MNLTTMCGNILFSSFCKVLLFMHTHCAADSYKDIFKKIIDHILCVYYNINTGNFTFIMNRKKLIEQFYRTNYSLSIKIG